MPLSDAFIFKGHELLAEALKSIFTQYLLLTDPRNREKIKHFHVPVLVMLCKEEKTKRTTAGVGRP